MNWERNQVKKPLEGLNSHLSVDRLTRIVAVLTSSRTGSSLMSSLLDGHPCILSTPDCLLLGYYQFWEQYGHLSPEKLVETFIDYYAVLFDARKGSKCPRTGSNPGYDLNFTSLGENRDQVLEVDVDIFKKSISWFLPNGKPVTRRLFFQALHIAYADAIGHQVDNDPIIAFGLHKDNPPTVRMFVDDFPDAFFLHMVRDPIQTMGSHFKHYWERDFRPLHAGDAVIRARFTSGWPVLPEHHVRSRAVRLEDLHLRPREVMLAVCSWLGIPWHDTLLESTVNGIKWWNDSGAIQISGFNEQILAQKYEAYIPQFDRIRLQVLFSYRFSHWGYFKEKWCRRWIVRILSLPFLVIPFKVEWLSIKGNLRPSLSFVSTAAHVLLRTRKLVMHETLKAIFSRHEPRVDNILC